MFLPSPFAFCLFCVVECAKFAQLLDQDDENLLADVFLHRKRYYLVVSMEFVIMFFITQTLFCRSWFISGILLFTSFTGFHILLPYCMFKVGFSRFDKKFQGFLGALKRRELCLFGSVRLNGNDADNLLLPLRMERRKCLQKLRRQIKHFEVASAKVRYLWGTSGKNQQVACISEYINEDLRTLSDERADISDDFLQISALRTCWQYLFLVRSEFFRLVISAGFSAPIFFRVFTLATCTIFETFSVFDNFELNAPIRMQSQNSDKKLGYGKSAVLSPLESTIFQLEWILENLRHLKRLPEGDGARNFTRSLRNVISIFDGPATAESGVNLSNNDRLLSNITDLPDNGNLEELQTTQNIREETVEDFQIFELDTGNADMESFDTEAVSGNTDGAPFAPEYVDKRPLLRELNTAISRRKDICIQREIVALAKLRKVPLEEISREELERREFKKVDEEAEYSTQEPIPKSHSKDVPISHVNVDASEIQQSKPVVLSRGAFGGMPDSTDLEAILRQRRNFPTALAMAAGEIFGGDSDSDECSGDG